MDFWQWLRNEPLRGLSIAAIGTIITAIFELYSGIGSHVVSLTLACGIILALLGLILSVRDYHTTLRNQLRGLEIMFVDLTNTVQKSLTTKDGTRDFSMALSHEDLLRTAILMLHKANRRALILVQNPGSIFSWSKRRITRDLEKTLLDTIEKLSEKNKQGSFTFLLCVSGRNLMQSLSKWKNNGIENVNRTASKMADGLRDKRTSGFFVMLDHDLPPFLIISDEDMRVWVPDHRFEDSPSGFIYVNYPARIFSDNMFKRYTGFYDNSDDANKTVFGQLKSFLEHS